MVLDNCEHLLDASADLIVDASGGLPGVDDADDEPRTDRVDRRSDLAGAVAVARRRSISLFTDRARRVRPDFAVTDDNAATVTEICQRLDGMPLAIELAAARVRALSLTEILDSLHDRFRLLTGGRGTAVRRQQSLARIGGLVARAADRTRADPVPPIGRVHGRLRSRCGAGRLQRGRVAAAPDSGPADLLVDKSLVVAESASGRTRYRLLETVRQYALEKLGESGEADVVRDRHRDYYTSIAEQFDAPTPAGFEPLLDGAEAEIDNLRAAFAWNQEHGEIDRALQLACSLYPVWLMRNRPLEGLAWFDSIDLSDLDAGWVRLSVRARSPTAPCWEPSPSMPR